MISYILVDYSFRKNSVATTLSSNSSASLQRDACMGGGGGRPLPPQFITLRCNCRLPDLHNLSIILV